MKTLIIYTSQTGFTKRYSQWLADEMKADIYDLKDAKAVKVENNDVPLSDTPFEKGPNMNLLWVLGAGVAGVAGAFGYGKHKKNASSKDEKKQ